MWTCFFLYPTCILAWPLLTSYSLDGEWEWVGILDVVPNIAGFLSLKTNSPKTSNVFDVFHRVPNMLGVQRRPYRQAERKWTGVVLSLIKKDGMSSTLPISPHTLFCFIFTTTIWRRYDSIFTIFTGAKVRNKDVGHLSKVKDRARSKSWRSFSFQSLNTFPLHALQCQNKGMTKTYFLLF